MAMSGTVHAINPRCGMVAIATDGYGFTIIELLGDEDIEIGDEMRWSDDTALGGESYRNVTKGETIDVYVQNHYVSSHQLRQQLLLR